MSHVKMGTSCELRPVPATTVTCLPFIFYFSINVLYLLYLIQCHWGQEPIPDDHEWATHWTGGQSMTEPHTRKKLSEHTLILNVIVSSNANWLSRQRLLRLIINSPIKAHRTVPISDHFREHSNLKKSQSFQTHYNLHLCYTEGLHGMMFTSHSLFRLTYYKSLLLSFTCVLQSSKA